MSRRIARLGATAAMLVIAAAGIGAVTAAPASALPAAHIQGDSPAPELSCNDLYALYFAYVVWGDSTTAEIIWGHIVEQGCA